LVKQHSPIAGKSILVAEDDFLLAQLIKEDLSEHGAQVIGPINSCARTLAIMQDGVDFDAAILDINLLDGEVYQAADILMGRGKPFVFASSVLRAQIPERFGAIPHFFKPLDMRRFFEALFEDR
jgi:CheY-like chemotaxis protein